MEPYVKSQCEREIDSELADGDKSKTKPVWCVCGSSDFFLSPLSKSRFLLEHAFFYLIEDVQDETW